MANWKERIEGAFRDRDRNIGKAAQKSRGVGVDNVQNPLGESEYERYHRHKREAENNLLGSGAYELLEKVRRDVWKTGSIRKLDVGGATLLLEASHNETIISEGKWFAGGSDGGGSGDSSGAGELLIRKFYDRLAITSSSDQSDLQVYEGNHIQESVSSSGFGWRDLYDDSGRVTRIRGGKEELEEVILNICLRRIKHGSLPPIPWYKRVFR